MVEELRSKGGGPLQQDLEPNSKGSEISMRFYSFTVSMNEYAENDQPPSDSPILKRSPLVQSITTQYLTKSSKSNVLLKDKGSIRSVLSGCASALLPHEIEDQNRQNLASI